jgi:glutamyl-tRNA reductase
VRVVLIGLSHKTASVDLRERISLYGRAPEETLHALRDTAHLAECAVLSTCNRTEFYGVTHLENWQERVLGFMAHHAGVSAGRLQDHVYSFEGTPAARHLFRVAAGLDSMVLGEGQVLSQVKDALDVARNCGTAGAISNGLFQRAITVGKRARTETEIGRGAVSISLAAVQLARQIFERLHNRTVLLIGAGETGEQTARALLAQGSGSRILVCNRTYERAAELARQMGGTALPWEQLGEALRQADIAITSTGSAQPIVSAELMRQVMRQRRGRELFLVDIAVPRDIEPAAGDLNDVYLYNIDDLQGVIEKGMSGRAAEAARVEGIIDEELQRFQIWCRGLEVGPTIRRLQEMGQTLVDAELTRLGGRLSHLSPRDRDVVDSLLKGVVNKLLRPPIMHLRAAAESGNGYLEVESVHAIFGLGAPDGAEELPRGVEAVPTTAEGGDHGRMPVQAEGVEAVR